MPSKKDVLVPLMVRVPGFLRGLLEKEAKKAGRSMNKEIIARLQGSFARDINAQNEREAIREMYENIERRLKDIEDFQAGRKSVMDARKGWELYTDDNGEYRWRPADGRIGGDEDDLLRIRDSIDAVLKDKEAS